MPEHKATYVILTHRDAGAESYRAHLTEVAVLLDLLKTAQQAA